jgi:hypothetical protein
MRRVIGLSTALAIVVIGVACMPPPSSWYGDADIRVGVVGDSLVHAAETGGGLEAGDPDRFLSQEMAAAGYRTSVSAFIGATTFELASLQPFPQPGPEYLVIGLGTNDMRDAKVSVETALGNIVSFLGHRPAACTVLITIVDEPAWGLDVTAPLYNAAMVQLAADRGDMVIADWAAQIDAHPD